MDFLSVRNGETVGGFDKILSDVLFGAELSNYCGLNSRGRW
jgi:hypothetical protein